MWACSAGVEEDAAWSVIYTGRHADSCRAYDATQHLLNCRHRLIVSTDSTIRRVSDLLDLDVERVRLWMFARAAAEPRDVWEEQSAAFAKFLAPK